MVKSYLGLVLLCLAASPLSAEDRKAEDRKDGWKLAWSDEFNTPGLPDASKWDYEEGYCRNRESQYYTRGRLENARVEDGMLVIESRKERIKNPKFDPGAKNKSDWNKTREYTEYTSASLTTRGKVEWTYGRIEVRAKLPTGRGMWPAIWMLGTNIRQVGWPACGEIDIMEYVGFDPNLIHANFHTKKYNHVLGTGKGGTIKIARPWEESHIYAIEWNPDRIDCFVDDAKYFTYKNEGTGADVWPFDKDQYLILNSAVGGAWGGQKGIDDSIFPQKFLIDYVRVYRKPTN